MDLPTSSDTTILIVDDNPVNIRMEQRILEKNGYITVTAIDGATGIEKARTLNPDLILLDINMPKKNGIDVCKVLKEDEETKDIQVIFVTASTDDEILTKAFESGGADYVRKPVNKMELLARIKSLMTQKKLMENFLLHEKLKGVIEMAGAICHEMNQPLQAISGYSELLLMDISKESPLYKNANNIKTQIENMGEITKKLMRITRYETKEYVKGTKIIDIHKASL